MTGGACDVYRGERLRMPDGLETSGVEFAAWFNALDAGMLEACR